MEEPTGISMIGLALHLTIARAVAILLVVGLATAAFSSTQYALVYNLAPPGHARARQLHAKAENAEMVGGIGVAKSQVFNAHRSRLSSLALDANAIGEACVAFSGL